MREVLRLTAGGRGVLEDGTHVDRVLPGELVELVDGLARIRKPVPARVRPPCSHFNRCGGCTMQHASDDFLAAWKTDLVSDALRRVGLEAPIRRFHPSPPAARRRAVLAGRRTKSGVLLGFHQKGTDILVDTPDCHLLDPRIVQAWPRLETLVRALATRKQGISLTVRQAEAGLDVSVGSPRPLVEALRLQLSDLAQSEDLARLAWGDEVILERRAPVVDFGGAIVAPPPGAFLQATPDGEEALARAVLEGAAGAKQVVDLFAGCGTFALRLARGANVLAVEGSAAQTAALEQGWRKTDGLHKLQALTRNLFSDPLTAAELADVDVAVLDPPRAGAAAQVAELAGSGIGRVVMVSCNPVTFARDCRTLTDAGYALDWIDVVDQFRWSTHVEVAALLTRK